MTLDFRHSSPVSFKSSSREPYSYAAEHALSEREPSLEELEAAVKETPPRPTSTLINGHLRNSSEPRSLGDVMDEGEKMLAPGSPSLRHTKGRLEHDIRPKSPNDSYANVVKHESDSTDRRVSSAISDIGKEMDHSAHTFGSSSKHGSSVKQQLLDARPKDSGAQQESFADVVKHQVGHDQDPSHAQREPTSEKQEVVQQALSFPDIPQHDPVKKENLQEPASFPELPETDSTKQQETTQLHDLPDLPKHEPSATSDSYANVVKQEPTSPVLRPDSPTLQTENEKPPTTTLDHVSTNDVSKQPVDASHASTSGDTTKTDSLATNGTGDHTPTTTHGGLADGGKPGSRDSHDSAYGSQYTTRAADHDDDNDDDDKQPGSLIYENYESRSGTNLASIALGKEYELAMSQTENEHIDSDQAEKESTEGQGTASTLVSGRRAGAGWSRSAVRWAPLNVPVQRRLQTLAVLGHSLSIASFVAFFFLLCTIPVFWPIIVAYLIYVLLSSAGSDGKLARRSEYLRRSKFWSLFASYFPARLHRSVELEPTRKYIFGYHPHGIISHGAFAAFATEALGFSSLFPGITNSLLTLDSNFRIPLYRDWILRLGLASVARESCENILTRGGPNGQGMGRAITIVIGGARESLDAIPGTLNLVLAKRKGFVKLAVRTGADLVPVLAFGENDIYEQISSETHPWIHKWQLLVKRFMGFTLPLFHARGIFNYDVGIMPYRRPINIVVGRPIRTRIAKKPDPAYVDDLHKQYTDELLHLWNEWKDTFAPDRKAELQIIE